MEHETECLALMSSSTGKTMNVYQFSIGSRSFAPPIIGHMRPVSLRSSGSGHELRRPLADFLRDGIHELRVRKGRVNYRILYFFHGRNLPILGHALTKEEADPSRHSYSEEEKA